MIEMGEGGAYRGRYLEKAPKLRLEFGWHTKFQSTSEQNHLYHKGVGRMESDRHETHATLEYVSSYRIGALEFWDGTFTFLRLIVRIK